VTAPAPAQQQDQQDAVRDAVIAALALWLASKASLGAVYLPDLLFKRLVGLGLDGQSVRRAGWLGLSLPLPGRGPHGSPRHEAATTTVRKVKADEPELRAQYIVTAAERLSRAQQLGVYDAASRLESTYTDQQRAAAQNRIKAAQALDKAATGSASPWLTWRTKHDNRVEAECAALEGRVFTLDNLPTVDGREVMPGAVHVRCRCSAQPWSGSALPAITA
jgi:hypothetical protein